MYYGRTVDVTAQIALSVGKWASEGRLQENPNIALLRRGNFVFDRLDNVIWKEGISACQIKSNQNLLYPVCKHDINILV